MLANRAIRCATLRSRMAVRRLRRGNGAGKRRPRRASLDWQRQPPSPRRARRLMDRPALRPNAFLRPAISRGSVHFRAERRGSRGRSKCPSNSGRHIDADGLRVTPERGADGHRYHDGTAPPAIPSRSLTTADPDQRQRLALGRDTGPRRAHRGTHAGKTSPPLSPGNTGGAGDYRLSPFPLPPPALP